MKNNHSSALPRLGTYRAQHENKRKRKRSETQEEREKHTDNRSLRGEMTEQVQGKPSHTEQQAESSHTATTRKRAPQWRGDDEQHGTQHKKARSNHPPRRGVPTGAWGVKSEQMPKRGGICTEEQGGDVEPHEGTGHGVRHKQVQRRGAHEPQNQRRQGGARPKLHPAQ